VKTADSGKFQTYHTELLLKGVFIPPSQFETCFISNAHSSQDLATTTKTISTTLEKLK
jgi:glutamate-1-semialdehyde 2,1-aminomutase